LFAVGAKQSTFCLNLGINRFKAVFAATHLEVTFARIKASAPHPMSNQKVAIDRFTTKNQVLKGQFLPNELARLKPFLATADGEIRYELTGMYKMDATGRRKKRVKCIISGYFFLLDPQTLEAEPYELGIESQLVLVEDEAELPPLEQEQPDEDYVTVGKELDVVELVEEEILLDLPFWAIAADSKGDSEASRDKSALTASAGSQTAKSSGSKSPFAKLAALKKSAADENGGGSGSGSAN
jgi:uncharacterized metal-binding protein YceD (DUF177 family)